MLLNMVIIVTRLYAALPRHDAASPRGPRQAAGLGSQGGFVARGFAATHGRVHVPTTIRPNIEIHCHLHST